MKNLIFTLSLVFSLSSIAAGKLHCVNYHDGTVTSTGGDHESFFNYCGDQLALGGVCFTGKRGEVIELLKLLDEWDIYGGEASIINIHYVGKTRIAYDIHDGPNDMIMYENKISRCTRDFFTGAHQE